MHFVENNILPVIMEDFVNVYFLYLIGIFFKENSIDVNIIRLIIIHELRIV